MKFCSRCGQAVSDGARFCNNCGYTFGTQRGVYIPPPSFLPGIQPVPAGLIKRTRFALRDLTASPLYLAWMMLLTLQTTLFAVSYLSSFYISGVVNMALILLAVIFIFPMILSSFASLALLCGVAGKSGKRPSPGGLTALRVSVIFKMVCLIVLLSFGLLAVISELPNNSTVPIFGLEIGIAVFFVLYVTGFALMIVYYSMLSSSLGKMKNALLTGCPNEGASVFAQVINILLFLGLMMLFFVGMSNINEAANDRFSYAKLLLASVFVGAIRYLFTAILMMKYNRDMRKLM